MIPGARQPVTFSKAAMDGVDSVVGSGRDPVIRGWVDSVWSSGKVEWQRPFLIARKGRAWTKGPLQWSFRRSPSLRSSKADSNGLPMTVDDRLIHAEYRNSQACPRGYPMDVHY